MKSANLSRTEDLSLAEFKCCRCSLVNTISQCHDDNIRPDTLFISGFVHLERAQRNSRIPLPEILIHKLMMFVKPRQILPCGADCSPL